MGKNSDTSSRCLTTVLREGDIKTLPSDPAAAFVKRWQHCCCVPALPLAAFPSWLKAVAKDCDQATIGQLGDRAFIQAVLVERSRAAERFPVIVRVGNHLRIPTPTDPAYYVYTVEVEPLVKVNM
jgi:hypothetical protein